MAIITAKDIAYTYAIEQQAVAVLHHINFTVAAGEMVAIQGPSGSGKSTFLYLLGCILQCQQGSVVIDGINIANLNRNQLAFVRNKKIGFVFQQFYLLPKTTVIDNILLPTVYPLEIANSTLEDREYAITLAGQLGLDKRLYHYPNALSGGEQQRVAIARALIRGAKIILADEPTGNLDSKMSAQILSLLQQLNREQNVTIVLVTHDSNIAHQADKIFHFYDGTIKSIEAIKPISAVMLPAKKTLLEPPVSTVIPKDIYFKGRTIVNLLTLSWRNILRNKTRSILTMIGIIIGIATILTMVTLGIFTKQKILDSYSTLGINTVLIYGQPNWALQATDIVPVMFEHFSLNDDLLPLKTIFPAIKFLSPMLYGGFGMQVSYGGRNVESNIMVLGVDKDYLKISDRKLVSGHDFYVRNITYADSVCIVGHDIAERLFQHQDPLNKIIQVGDKNRSFGCSVIGTLQKSKASLEGVFDQNLQIIVPYTYFKHGVANYWENQINIFTIKLKSTKDVVPTSHGIENYFKSKYGVSGIFIADPNALLLAQMNKFLNLFTLMLAIISLLSLVVGGIGIANMMLASISERLKEIGLRKALGATNYSVRLQFLFEAVIICCCAGLIGLILGFITYESIIYIASQFVKNLTFSWIVSWPAIALAIISMIVVGVASGIIPAIRAESIDIIAAMRSE